MVAQVLGAIRQSQAQTRAGQQPGVLNFPALLEKNRAAVQMALPKHLDVDRVIRTALTAYKSSKALAKCSPMSIVAQVVQAAQLGLVVGGAMGEAYLVPFKAECQLIVGYAGLIKLACQAGTVDVYAHEVYAKDKFVLEYGLNRKLIHQPLKNASGFPASHLERGELAGFYAVAVERSGYRRFYAMSLEDVLFIRDGSKSYAVAKRNNFSTPWDTNFVEMGKKSAVRALMKYAVKSPQLSQAFAVNDAADAGRSVTLEEAADGVWTPKVDQETGEIFDGQPEAAAPAASSTASGQ